MVGRKVSNGWKKSPYTRAMKFYDAPPGLWADEKQQILKFFG
jgi:hypothetical protein